MENVASEHEDIVVPNNLQACEQDVLQNTAQTPGKCLQEARLAQGHSLESAASFLHLSPEVLRNLEKDNYAAFTAMTFVRGYLRNYAKYLKLQPEDLLLMLQKMNIKEKERSSLAALRHVTNFSDKPYSIGKLRYFSYFIFLLLAIGLFAWWHEQPNNLMALKNTNTSVLSPERSVNLKKNKETTLTTKNTQPLLTPKASGNDMSLIQPSGLPPLNKADLLGNHRFSSPMILMNQSNVAESNATMPENTGVVSPTLLHEQDVQPEAAVKVEKKPVTAQRFKAWHNPDLGQ